MWEEDVLLNKPQRGWGAVGSGCVTKFTQEKEASYPFQTNQSKLSSRLELEASKQVLDESWKPHVHFKQISQALNKDRDKEASSY